MLRGENIVCGTSTTGTGTLTLAAVPSGIGGVDFDAWLKATGIGFVSGNAVLVSYTIIEYTDATFAVAKFVEKGIGTLTLGASITAATLARTTVQTVSNANADSYQVGGGATAITIGTAANVLVFVGASAADLLAFSPYYETGVGDNLGVMPPCVATATTTGPTLVSATERHLLFWWPIPMLVKKATIRVATAYTGGTPVSNADFRIYAQNSSGRPGKLLLDLGLMGSAGTSLNSTGNVSTGVHANGFWLPPGLYFANLLPVLSGGTGGPALQVFGTTNGYIIPGNGGVSTLVPQTSFSATGGSIGAAPDPANVTGYAASLAVNTMFMFTLNSS